MVHAGVPSVVIRFITETQGAPELTLGMRLVNENRPHSAAPAVPADVAGEGTPRLAPRTNPRDPPPGEAPAVPTGEDGEGARWAYACAPDQRDLPPGEAR